MDRGISITEELVRGVDVVSDEESLHISIYRKSVGVVLNEQSIAKADIDTLEVHSCLWGQQPVRKNFRKFFGLKIK